MDVEDVVSALLTALPPGKKEMARHLVRLPSNYEVCTMAGPCEEDCDDECDHPRPTVGDMTASNLLLDLCLNIAEIVRQVLTSRHLIPGIVGLVKVAPHPAPLGQS